MRPIFIITVLLSFLLAQDAEQTESLAEPEVDTTPQSLPSGLELGYKGLTWGSLKGSEIPTSFQSVTHDSLTGTQSFVGILGADSVSVIYAFADSGFWKVEIDFLIDSSGLNEKISNFRRLEKNISAVYGPPQKTNQKETGATGTYADIFNQKFANAFYRSTWDVKPAAIELLLHTSQLVPKTDLPIFSGDFTVFKLVYYNPDFMHSSQPIPQPEEIPSIFDIY